MSQFCECKMFSGTLQECLSCGCWGDHGWHLVAKQYSLVGLVHIYFPAVIFHLPSLHILEDR